MTAREFLKSQEIEICEKSLSWLTRYLQNKIDYTSFPDAYLPEDFLESADEPVGFQEFIESQESQQ